MSDRKRRPCPMCGQDEPRLRRVVEGWELSECRFCGFLYAPTILASTATEFDDSDDYQPIWRARHRQIYRLLADLLPPGELVVDVGAGFGDLGLLNSEKGRFQYVGFEPSPTLSAVARRRGVDMRTEFFEKGSLDRPAGAVVLDNVIEHVEDPKSLMRLCADGLHRGGVLVVIVPNRYDLRQIVPKWRRKNHWIPPEHINYFTPASLRKAFHELGMKPKPFGFRALMPSDWRYWPRAVAERLQLFPFGINVIGVRDSI